MGDQDAWEHLFREVYPRLRTYVAQRVAAREVDGVLEETMRRAVSAMDRFVGPADRFDEWVFSLARRVIHSPPSSLEREVLALRAVGGFTVEAVARILGRRPHVVRAAHARGLEQLDQETDGGSATPRPIDGRREVALLDALATALGLPTHRPPAAALFSLRTAVAARYV